MRREARVDAHQDAIVSALRAAGASVLSIGQPVDLLVGHRGLTLLLAVKSTRSHYGKAGASDNRRDFMQTWNGGAVSLVDGPEAALRALGTLSGRATTSSSS